VIRRGRVIAETPDVRPVVTLAGTTQEVTFRLRP
jgi:hypothetical protein